LRPRHWRLLPASQRHAPRFRRQVVQKQYGESPKRLVFGRSKPFASYGEMKRSITLDIGPINNLRLHCTALVSGKHGERRCRL